MTCLSCTHWRIHGCALGLGRFPYAGQACKRFEYEPGVDEGLA